tara:strand:+ start:360 stop:497 length:138 start_codon:yes stop_codon:yes gene_type:complete
VTEQRPYLEIPKPSEQDYRLYEEWAKKKKEEEEDKEERKVIIIDI